MSSLQVFSPADGTVVPLEQVPDPVFAEHMLGDGIAVNPSAGYTVAPFDGIVTTIHKSLHAVTVKKEDVEVLIHVGVESVGLNGEGFKAFVKTGDKVKQGQKLTEFDPAFLAQKIPSNLVIMIVTSPADTAIHKTNATQVQAGKDCVFCVGDAPAENTPATAPAAAEWLYSQPITIPNVNGLHARPAAHLAEAAKSYSFAIELEENGRTANVKSVVAVMGMGLTKGMQVRVRADAHAAQAAEALQKIASLLESGSGENPSEVTSVDVSTTDATPSYTTVLDLSKPSTLQAMTACTGLTHGTVYQWNSTDIIFEQTATDTTQETIRLEQAIAAVLQECQKEMAAVHNHTAQAILQAHIELLQDPFLSTESINQIQTGKSAPAAFNEAIRASIDVLKNTKNRLLMERVADLKDVRRRVLYKLTGQHSQKPHFPPNCIVLAEELLPSDIESFTKQVRGVILAYGSPTAHASILLRNMGLPSVVAAGETVLQIPDGTEVFVNATEGKIYLHLSNEEKNHFLQLMEQEKAANEQNLKAAKLEAYTKDGLTIHVSGNASSAIEARTASEKGADGLGLVRTEFVFYQKQDIPTEEEQYNAYNQFVSAFPTQTVTLRTLDVGGDKPVSYMPLPPEDNPIVGLRGVRNYEQYREAFLAQVRAMLRTAPNGQVRIMLPMISFVSEFLAYKKMIEEEKAQLGITAPVEIGMMVEVPAASLMAKQFAQYADFFSLGTNDLTQYTLAIDRGHKTLCSLADSLNPAVLQLIGQTCQGAQCYQRPVGVCGAMAGDLTAVPLLIGLGVTELAVGANAVAQVKALVRNLDKKHCSEVAQKALALQDAQQVRELVKAEFER